MIKIFNFAGIHGVVFANGAVHCAVSPKRGNDSNDSKVPLIILFDRNMKTHRKVLQPNYGEGECSCTLTTFGKSLSVLCAFERAHADIWVMENCDRECLGQNCSPSRIWIHCHRTEIWNRSASL